MSLKVSENIFGEFLSVNGLMPEKYYLFSQDRFREMFHGLTELNIQRDNALESVRNVYLHGRVCRVATGRNLSGFF